MIYLDIKKIKRLVNKYTRKYSTNDPYTLAGYLNIKVFFVPLGNIPGFYKYMKRHKCIFINSTIEDKHFQKFVMAHELGHALMHPKENFYYLENFTNLKVVSAEAEANHFAAQLLIPDEQVYAAFDNEVMTLNHLARVLGYNEKLIRLRFESSGLY